MNIDNRILMAAAANGMSVADLLDRLMDGATVASERGGVVDRLGTFDPSIGAEPKLMTVSAPNAAHRAETATETAARTFAKGPRTHYLLNVGPRGKAPDLPKMYRTAEMVLEYVKSRKTPVTKPEVERATGLAGKTVESAIHYLRSNGVILAEPIA